MNKKQIVLTTSFFILIILLILYFILKSESNSRIIVNGINNFNPISGNYKNYLLYYPADARVSQENTIVKEVTQFGEIVREYEIKDSDFRRISIHQKPTNINQLYISFFGEATVDNYYFTYNIIEKKFKKINLNYFDHEVGVEQIAHYGEDTLFQTLVSHKTGEQNLNFDMTTSISNYSTKQSFETEYGNIPKSTPILEFNNKLIYGTSGQVNEGLDYENSGIGIIDLENQTVEYKTPFDNTDLIPIYSTKNHAYILSDSGKFFVYDKNFNYKLYEPFKKMSKQDTYYNEDSPPLIIDVNTALYSIYSEEKGSIIGIMNFEPELNFQPLKKDYIKPNYNYRFLYQDAERKEIYLLRTNDYEESLIVIDNEDFNLQAEIPVKYSHLLDFVVKN